MEGKRFLMLIWSLIIELNFTLKSKYLRSITRITYVNKYFLHLNTSSFFDEIGFQ